MKGTCQSCGETFEHGGQAKRGLRGCFYGTLMRHCQRAGFRWPKKKKAR